MYTHALGYEELNGTVYNNVRLCPRDQNSKWPPFPSTIAKIEHNLIAFCYINMILFCPFLYLAKYLQHTFPDNVTSVLLDSEHCTMYPRSSSSFIQKY